MTRVGATLSKWLLLALAIMVIIAGAALIVIQQTPMQDKTARSEAKVRIDLFATALDAYQLDVGSFPSTAAGLQALRKPPADLADPSKWNGPYVTKDIPLDPCASRINTPVPACTTLAGLTFGP